MTTSHETIHHSPRSRRKCVRPMPALAALFLGMTLGGCAAMSNPVADGIPVRRLPPEVLAVSKKELTPLPLSLLRQKRPDTYRLDAGDVLGIWIDQAMGGKPDQPIPVTTLDPSLPPALGYPVLVESNGTISLPLLPKPIPVKGMSFAEAKEAIRKAYTLGIGQEGKVILQDVGRFVVTLQRRRRYHIVVVRQDSPGGPGTGSNASGGLFGIGSIGVAAGTSGRGTGVALDLPAYENDVMDALAQSGGLPGFGAADEVIIERGSYRDGDDPAAVAERLKACGPTGPGYADGITSAFGARVTRIPLRLRKGQRPPFRPEDVILETGDVVYIPSRDAEQFYTGGLLFSGQYALPRDYDLGVVEAIAVTRGTLVNGGTASLNNLSGSTFGGGTVGAPNPSLVSVVRRPPCGGQFTIAVDLNRALRDPRENLLIMPNDVVIMQFSPGEAFVRYFTSVFHLDFLGTIIRQNDLTGTATLTLP